MEFMSSIQGGLDELKPSLFELLSEQQLGSLIPPSLRYLLALATQRHPRYLLRALNSFDEIYAVLMLLVERYYLRVYGGGFTENFYGLKRERVLRIKGGEVRRAQQGAAPLVRETLKLREADVWKNLAVMVGLPYLKRKLDEAHDIYAPQASVLGQNYHRDTLPSDATMRQRILYYYKWFLRKVYPSVNAAYYFALLAFNLAYLFDGSKYPSPFLWLIGTRIRRLGEADYRAISAATETKPAEGASKPARPGQANSIFNPRTLSASIGPRLLSSLRILLPTSIFALKFLEWWHASDFARQLSRKAAEGLELPPPTSGQPPAYAVGAPKKDPAAATATTSPTGSSMKQPLREPQPPLSASTNLPIFTVAAPTASTSDLCPICSRPVTTATAAPSGYVYCYTCIHKWVEGTHERQERFMAGESDDGLEPAEDRTAWRGSDEKAGAAGDEDGEGGREKGRKEKTSRWDEWESGKGRCAVSGRRVLGGTEGLRRIIA